MKSFFAVVGYHAVIPHHSTSWTRQNSEPVSCVPPHSTLRRRVVDARSRSARKDSRQRLTEISNDCLVTYHAVIGHIGAGGCSIPAKSAASPKSNAATKAVEHWRCGAANGS